MKNFILCLVACCTFLMFGTEVNAAEKYVNYAEPSYGDNSGYLILEFASGSVATYFWSAYSQSEYLNDVESVDTGMSIVIDESKVIFNILTDINSDAEVTNVTTYYTFSRYKANGNLDIEKSGSVVDKNPTYTYTTSASASIVGFSYKGNVSMITNQLDNTPTSPVLIFGDDVVGQYIHDLYVLCSSNNEMLEEYLPQLEKLESIDDCLALLKNLCDTYLPKLNKIEFGVTQMYIILQDIQDYIQEYYPQMLNELNFIDAHLVTIKNYLYNQSASEKDTINQFEGSSSDQTNDLNNLNDWKEQYETTVPLDQLEDSVDDNLNVDIDANYGLLLSTFTTNNRILTILLMVASVSLISYVLFGKR